MSLFGNIYQEDLSLLSKLVYMYLKVQRTLDRILADHMRA